MNWNTCNYEHKCAQCQAFEIQMDSLNNRLKEERQRLGLTQDEFGELGGVKRNAQKNYENGTRTPDASYLSAIAKHDVDVSYILTGERTVRTEALENAQEAFYDCVKEVEAWLKENNKSLTDKQIVKVALQYYQAKSKDEIKEDQVALNLILKTAVNL